MRGKPEKGFRSTFSGVLMPTDCRRDSFSRDRRCSFRILFLSVRRPLVQIGRYGGMTVFLHVLRTKCEARINVNSPRTEVEGFPLGHRLFHEKPMIFS